MKKIIAIAVLSALAASPVLAEKFPTATDVDTVYYKGNSNNTTTSPTNGSTSETTTTTYTGPAGQIKKSGGESESCTSNCTNTSSSTTDTRRGNK